MKKQILLLMQCVVAMMIFNSCGNGKAAAEVDAEVQAEDTVVITGENDGRYVKVDTIGNLVVYYPQFSKIDLACGKMPEKSDTNVVLCAAAAFTGTFLDEFKHSNVASDHVSGGVRYDGYECKVNTGGFAYYGGNEWEFVYGDYSPAFDKAAEQGGMAYAQVMMINNGEVKQTYRVNPKNTRDVNEFRALCELNGKLCMVDSKGFVNFVDFVNELSAADVTHAIYMDMGEGWNYSWWRHSCGAAVEIHTKESGYTTNWITFYK